MNSKISFAYTEKTFHTISFAANERNRRWCYKSETLRQNHSKFKRLAFLTFSRHLSGKTAWKSLGRSLRWRQRRRRGRRRRRWKSEGAVVAVAAALPLPRILLPYSCWPPAARHRLSWRTSSLCGAGDAAREGTKVCKHGSERNFFYKKIVKNNRNSQKYLVLMAIAMAILGAWLTCEQFQANISISAGRPPP